MHFAEEQIEKRNKILQDADIEEEKRDVIHREIGKFREIMKVGLHDIVIVFSRFYYVAENHNRIGPYKICYLVFNGLYALMMSLY